MGTLPDSVSVEVYTGRDGYPSDPADVEVWVPPFLSSGDFRTVLDDLTGLKVVQLLSAGAEVWVGRVPESVVLCDAQGVHTASTSEWALTAMLASLRGFDIYARQQVESRWQSHVGTGLAGLTVLVVGAGDIGTAIAERVRAFDAEPVMVARRGRPGVHPVTELPGLLPTADVVVLIVPLTPATRGMVDATFLSRMHDGALLVNAARGPVVDTDALIAETASGRLRAALDVTDPEPLPADNPLWTTPGVLITPHVGGAVHGLNALVYRMVGDQLRRYAAGEPLRNVVTEAGY